MEDFKNKKNDMKAYREDNLIAERELSTDPEVCNSVEGLAHHADLGAVQRLRSRSHVQVFVHAHSSQAELGTPSLLL